MTANHSSNTFLHTSGLQHTVSTTPHAVLLRPFPLPTPCFLLSGRNLGPWSTEVKLARTGKPRRAVMQWGGAVVASYLSTRHHLEASKERQPDTSFSSTIGTLPPPAEEPCRSTKDTAQRTRALGRLEKLRVTNCHTCSGQGPGWTGLLTFRILPDISLLCGSVAGPPQPDSGASLALRHQFCSCFVGLGRSR